MAFGPILQSALRGGKTKSFDLIFIGASTIKSCVRSRIFRYDLPKDNLSKGQKTWGGGALWAKGLTNKDNIPLSGKEVTIPTHI